MFVFRPTALLRDVSELLRLAWPVMVSRSGFMVMAMADAVMVGRHSAQELAYLGIAFAPVATLLLTLAGCVMGTLVLTAATFGRGEIHLCGAIWRRAVPYALALGAAAALITATGADLLRALGQSPEIAAGGGPVVRVLGLGIAPALVFLASTYFLEGIRRPMPGMVFMVAANALNVLLNWILISGHLGVPAFGAAGAAAATTAVRTLLAIAMVCYIWWLADRDRFGIRAKPAGGFRTWARQRQIGYAAGASIGVEAGAFSAITLFAGWLGPLPLAAFTIALNLLALVFMVAIGIGAATAVRVGIASGARDAPAMARAGWVGLGAVAVAMVLFGALFAIAADTIATVYTDDAQLARVAAPVVAFLGFVMLADGGQGVMANALRGRGETWAATAIQALAYIGVMIPLAWALAFPFGRGLTGLFEAVLVASIVSVTLLVVRFHWLAGRDRRQSSLSPGRAAR